MRRGWWYDFLFPASMPLLTAQALQETEKKDAALANKKKSEDELLQRAHSHHISRCNV